MGKISENISETSENVRKYYKNISKIFMGGGETLETLDCWIFRVFNTPNGENQ